MTEKQSIDNLLHLTSSEERIYLSPSPVGYWISHDKHVKFGVYTKPKWLWRKMTKILLGWGYEEAKNKTNQ